MRVRTIHLVCGCVAFCFGALQPAAPASEAKAKQQAKPKTVHDIMWAWGTVSKAGRGEPGRHTLATYTKATPKEKARLLGVPNIMMCGNGLPSNDANALEWTEEVAGARSLVWEITTDDGLHKPPFEYTKTAARIRMLKDKYPKIEAVLLDDMSSLSMKAGFRAKHVRALRKLLPGKYEAIRLWGVVYTMNFQKGKEVEGIDEMVRTLDVVNLWTWHAKDLKNLAKNVAHVEKLVPDTPIILGLYLYDYGGGRRMPMDIHEQQCATALKLAKEGRIEGIVFLTIDEVPEVLDWTTRWIKKVGGEKLPAGKVAKPGVGPKPK